MIAVANINDELQEKREQKESVKGEITPFRVEFRYSKGTLHWHYFKTHAEALQAKDTMCQYNIYGQPTISHPLSQVVQKQGVKGDWSKFDPTKR